MNILSLELCPGWRLGALFGLILLLGVSEPALAGDDSPSRLPLSSVHASTQNRVISASPVFASNWLSSLFNKIESWLGDRTHMIQFCAIAMVIGLLIIWWRKT